jgi:hypothetical protein
VDVGEVPDRELDVDAAAARALVAMGSRREILEQEHEAPAVHRGVVARGEPARGDRRVELVEPDLVAIPVRGHLVHGGRSDLDHEGLRCSAVAVEVRRGGARPPPRPG